MKLNSKTGGHLAGDWRVVGSNLGPDTQAIFDPRLPGNAHTKNDSQPALKCVSYMIHFARST